MPVTHRKVSAKADTGDPTIVQGPDWNDTHVITGIAFAAPVGVHADDEIWVTRVGVSPNQVFTIWQRVNGQDVAWFTTTR